MGLGGAGALVVWEKQLGRPRVWWLGAINNWKGLSQCPCQVPSLSLAFCCSGGQPACLVLVSCPDRVAASAGWPVD
jgi:hypothetical protein